MNNRRKGIVAIVASAFGFALMAACVRLCDDFGASVPCFEKSFFRNFVALVIAAVALFRGGRRSGPTFALPGDSPFRVVGALLVRSVLGTIGIFSNFYALSHIPIADGQTLNKTAPFWTLVFAWTFVGERASARQLAAVLAAFLGAVLVVKPGFAGAASFPLAMGLLGGVCAGGAYAAVRALGRDGVNPSLIVFVFSAFSCVASVPFVMADFVPLTAAQLFVLIGAGAAAAMGQFGVTLAYRYAAPREIAVFDYTNILFTAALGYWLFGQVPDPLSAVGMLIIIAAAILLRSIDRRNAAVGEISGLETRKNNFVTCRTKPVF